MRLLLSGKMKSTKEYWWKALTHIILIQISGTVSCIIEGVLHGEVLLPCLIPHKTAFNIETFVAHWQTTLTQTTLTPEVLHSFHFGKEQPKYQHERFKGRAQFFPQEFPKGNISLLLRNLQTSDAGNYSCRVYLSDEPDDDIAHHVELLIKDSIEELSTGYEARYACVVLAPIVLLIFIGWYLCRGKKRRSTGEDGAELLSTPDSDRDIMAFRNIAKRTRTCCSAGPCGSESDNCLIREISIINIDGLQGESISDLQNSCEDTITSTEMFTDETKHWSSKRMLILGQAGIGKTCFCEELIKDWGSGERNCYYKCIICMSFRDLNSIKERTSLMKLLQSKWPPRNPPRPVVLRELLSSGSLLLILDGLDEFEHDANDLGELICDDNMDNDISITSILMGILTKKLLPDTDVLVTSGFNSWKKWKRYFTSMFIIKEFTEKQIWEFCQKFNNSNQLPRHICEFVRQYTLSSLVSIPFLIRALCEIFREPNFCCYKGNLNTWTQILFTLLKCHLRSTSPEVKLAIEECSSSVLMTEHNLQESTKHFLEQLAKMSYENLISNMMYIKKENLWSGSEILLNPLCKFFLMKNRDGSIFEYRHYSIRDLFATLYCIGKIQNNVELKECLNAWAFGEVPSSPTNMAFLQSIPCAKQERFCNFVRIFLGFLSYGNMDSVLSTSCALQSSSYALSKAQRKVLSQWLQQSITKDTDLINIFHYVFEIHDSKVTRDVAKCFKNVGLHNTQLSPLDITAMQYTLSEAEPNRFALQLCGLSNEGLKLLPMIRRCKHVWLNSNNLTAKSVDALVTCLMDKNCATESLTLDNNKLGSNGVKELWKAIKMNTSLKVLCLNNTGISGKEGTEGLANALEKNTHLNELWLGNNQLGDEGAQNIWKALEKKRHLRTLYLNTNNITDEGTKGMAKSLKTNTKLKELYLCGNPLGNDGLRNIRHAAQHDLKIIFRITDDEGLLCYMMEKIQHLNTQEWQNEDNERSLHLLQTLQQDLGTCDNPGNEIVTHLQQQIQRARNIIMQHKKRE